MKILELLKRRRFLFFFIIYLGAVFVYFVLCKKGFIEALYSALALFALNISPNSKGEWCNVWLYGIGFAAAFYTVLNVFLLIAKDFGNWLRVKRLLEQEYVLVYNLNAISSYFIDALLKKKEKVLVIEKDLKNTRIDRFIKKGVGFIFKDIKELDNLGLKGAKFIYIFEESDTRAIERALDFIRVLKSEKKNIYIHLNDENILFNLYKKGGLVENNSNIVLESFNVYKYTAYELFLKMLDRSFDIESEKDIKIAVVGASGLGVEIVGKIAELAHFPNENRVVIYCIDKDREGFKKAVLSRFINIEEIENLSLEFISLDNSGIDFYKNPLWLDGLDCVVLSYDDEDFNIKTALKLIEFSYLRVLEELKTEIFYAVYQENSLANEIDKNMKNYKNLHSFAKLEEIFYKREEEKYLKIAKAIHFIYEQQRFNKELLFKESKELEDKWINIDAISDRDSSFAQAEHIVVKLRALGLDFRASDKKAEELLEHNRNMLMAKIGSLLKAKGIDYDSLESKEFNYFPTNYDDIVEKLIRAEHNRWVAYHFLRGWRYSVNKNKAIKEHNCFIPLSKFPDELKYLAEYDLNSIIFIPNFLASVGYEIVEKSKGE